MQIQLVLLPKLKASQNAFFDIVHGGINPAKRFTAAFASY
jgi:hypothetical protein